MGAFAFGLKAVTSRSCSQRAQSFRPPLRYHFQMSSASFSPMAGAWVQIAKKRRSSSSRVIGSAQLLKNTQSTVLGMSNGCVYFVLILIEGGGAAMNGLRVRSEEHTSELQ